MDPIILGCIIGLIGIVLLKVLNLVNQNKLYAAGGAILGGVLSIILWAFVLFLFTASITNKNISTITGAPSGTITIVDQGVQYVGLIPFMNFANILFLACLFLSVIEIFSSLGREAIGMKAGPRSEKYQV